MTRAGALGAAAAAVVAVVAVGLLLLGGGDAPPDPRPARPGGATGSTAEAPPEPRPTTLAPPPRPGDPARPATPTGAPAGPGEAAPTGPALAALVARIVREGEGATTEAAERQAAQALERLLDEVGERGDAALGDVASLVEPGAPPGVQEVGVRLLGRLGSAGSADALRRLAALAGAPRAATQARLLALRTLDGAPASARTLARSTIVSVLRTRGDAEVRAFAASLLADDAGVEDDLAAVVSDRADEVAVRAAAHEALATLDPTRARRTLDAVKDDPVLAEWLKQAPR